MNGRAQSLSFSLLIAASVVLLPGAFAHAAPGALLQTVPIPAAAECNTEGAATGRAVATVQGSKAGFPAIPVLLVTTCENFTFEPFSRTVPLFFIDPAVGTVVKTLNTFVKNPDNTIAPPPSGGWRSLTSRPDRGDLLACSGDEGTELWALDISIFTATTDGTATKLRDGAGLTCDVAWDVADNTIFQGDFADSGTAPIHHIAETGTGIIATIDSGCDDLDGLAVAGGSLLIGCDVDESITIRQVDKTTGAFVRTITTPYGNPSDLECDAASFATTFKDGIWAKDSDSLTAVELPLGLCSVGRGADLCAGGTAPDTDGDGLLDCWETAGITVDGVTLPLCVDSNANGVNDPGECADPLHKDAFVEIDYMPFHRPDPVAVDRVIRAFAAGPVPNPDNTTGVRLHLQINEQLPQHFEFISLVPCSGPPLAGHADYDDLKARFFGSAAERNDARTIAAKKFAFKYGIFAHSLSGFASTSGCAEVHGNDFIVSLGRWAQVNKHGVGNTDQQAGTLLHELGHTYNLRHGGGDNVNCKPNYPSAMSYSRQFAGSPILNRPLDYSRVLLPPLVENSLTEQFGIGGFAGQTAFGPPVLLKPTVADATAAISWNRDADTADVVSQDVNNLGIAGCPSSANETLIGFDDWANLKFNFLAAPDFADGVHLSIEEALGIAGLEITLEEATTISPDTDGDGIENILDNCPLTPNVDQTDVNEDGVGDACPAIQVKAQHVKNRPVKVSRRETVPVAIFSTETFDATEIDAATLVMRGTPAVGDEWVRTAFPKRGRFCKTQDVNNDGLPDLVCNFSMKEPDRIATGDTDVTVEARTVDGALFQGHDFITVIP